MYKITIPKPCFESWEQMTPHGNGRYCSSCAKTVVDFSVMSDEEVQLYFTVNFNKSICGRFNNLQLQRIVITVPQNIFRLQLPFWKKFLVILLLSYGGSFMGIDTILASSSTFSQGEPVVSYNLKHKTYTKTKNHKRKKSRKHRKYMWSDGRTFQLDKLIFSTLGMVASQPVPEVSLDPVIQKKKSFTDKYSGDSRAYMEKALSEPTDDKHPFSPARNPANTEFVIPAILYRKRGIFSKKKI